ncbi:MAG TPA: 4Fe-4S binding protein [Dehalococcoidia bacterium]|nr:4Fe-4S binding protein [Dehalococcoidia bacterium]
MTTKTVRKIVHIDEEKCDGCGVCLPSCAEGALQIVDGKAKLISEKFCDGLGACLGECPLGAITIEERIAEEFDEESVKEHLAASQPDDTLACGCPSSTAEQFDTAVTEETLPGAPQPAMLRHWPVQLTLVPPKAPFLQGTDLMLTADCVPFAYAGFHRDFIQGHSLLVACPKLDDFPAHMKKLTDVLSQSDIKSLTVVHMEVPCCSGLVHMAREAIKASGKNIPLKEVTIGVHGEVLG